MTTRRAPSKIIPRAFPGITPDEVQDLISFSKVNNYPPDTVLCRENAIEHIFYMILEGEVEVSKSINESEARLLQTLGPGDFFGEMGIIHNAPRAATVVSKTNLVALELDREAFDAVLKRSSSIAMAMVHEISNRLRENDELAIEDLRMRARELAEAYQKLAELDKARREFLTNVAHELRTPLMAASGYLQILQGDQQLPPEQLTQALDTVSRNVQNIVTLVNDILFLQELDLVLPEFQAIDLESIATNVVKDFRSQAEKNGVKLQVKGNAKISPVSGDEKSLEKALKALVDNAIKFSPKGGKVELRLKNLNDGKVEIAVKDHGIGISPEIEPHIFDRFYHLEKSGDDLFGGIGLGLAITRQVIQQHNGTIVVRSKVGKGSTFIVTLQAWNGKS